MTIRGLLGMLWICLAGAALAVLMSPDSDGVTVAGVLLAFWLWMVGWGIRDRRRD